MPSKFTETERKMIRDQLFIEGKRLFELNSYSRTSIDEIVHAVGIAKGSFYKFYDNKACLFFDILESIEIKSNQEAIHTLSESDNIIENFKKLLRQQLESVMKEPLLQASMDTQFFINLWVQLPENRQVKSEQLDINKMHVYESILKEHGYAFQFNFKTTSGILRSLAFTLIHQELMGEEAEIISEFYINTVIEKMIIKIP